MGNHQKPGALGYHTADGRDNPSIFSPWLVLSLLLVGALFFAACSDQPSPTELPASATPELLPTATSTPPTPSPTPTITPQPTSSLEVKAADLDDITLEFWHPWSGATGDAFKKSLDEFNAGNPYGISVEAISQGDLNSLYEKLDTADLETGLPNLAVGANYQIQSWISTGKPVAGLDTYVSDPEWGYSVSELADFNELFLQQDIKEGSRFGLPAVRSAQVMYYNTTWAEELGFTTPPRTPEQFKTQACAAAQTNQNNDNPDDDGTGGWLINTNPSGILSWLFAFDSQVLLPDDSGYQFNTPQSEAALLFLKELIDEGCAFELLESPAEVEFANRQALFITSPLSNINFQNSEFVRAENDDSWTVTGFPSAGGEPASSVYGPSYFMFAGTPEENLAAWLAIKWLLSPEQDASMVAARGTFPILVTTLDFLHDYADENPQWAAAQDILDHAKTEPGLESWGSVRWILGDVGTQIFRYYFTPDRVPATLELMDETAAELHDLSN
jgi:ABC-type glycerol-3-phosphate transport system substrate-binding protein